MVKNHERRGQLERQRSKRQRSRLATAACLSTRQDFILTEPELEVVAEKKACVAQANMLTSSALADLDP